MDHKILIECDCGCSILNIAKDDDDDFAYLNTYRADFFTEQDGFWDLFKKRIKSVWYAILGKDFYLYEIVLDKDKIEQLKKIVNEL